MPSSLDRDGTASGRGQCRAQNRSEAANVGLSSGASNLVEECRNGLGLLRKMANSNATAVSVFSPPLMRDRLRISLPGGRAVISMPVSSTSEGILQHNVGHAPPEQFAEEFLEMDANGFKRVVKSCGYPR